MKHISFLGLYPVLFGVFFSASIIAQNQATSYEEAFRNSNSLPVEQQAVGEKTLQNGNSSDIIIRNVSTNEETGKVFAPPANDECVNAIALTIGGADYVYSNVGATANASDPAVASWPNCVGGGANNIKHTVWFKFTVTGGPLNITVSSQGPNLNNNAAVDKALYSVFSGGCGFLTQIGTTRAGTYGNFNSKSINIANLANGTYYIMTDGLCSQTGNYRIRVNITPPGAPTLWYAAGTIPTLSSVTTGGQWGTYAATTEPSASCGAAGMGFSDWYQFVYNSATQNHIGILDHALQSGFYIGLYDAGGTQLICNKWGQADYPSYTWDLSAQEGIAMHMPNIPLRELGLVNGATYYVRIANTSTAAENVNTAVNKVYTARIGNYMPVGDTYLDSLTLTLTQQPTYSWLTGQTNRFCGHSKLTEPEQGNLAWNIDNSLLYKFNTGAATSVDVKLQNVTYYNHSASTAEGQISVLTSPTAGTSMGSNAAFTGATFTLKESPQQQIMSVVGLSPNTDYWIMVDGRGGYEGTKLTFDISVSTTQPLPIELALFTGRNAGDKNILEWTTSMERNNDYFSVEKSIDGRTFEEIAQVNGAGNSNMPINYSISDDEIYPGISYYRLKQVDFDKSYAYSSIIAIKSGNKQLSDLIVIPNPANGNSANLLLTNGFSGLAHISVYSVTGQIVQDRQIYNTNETNIIPLDLSTLSQGVYFLSVQIGDDIQKIKFVRQ